MGTWSKIGLGLAGLGFLYFSGVTYNIGEKRNIDINIQGFQMAKLEFLEDQNRFIENYKMEMGGTDDMYSGLITEWYGDAEKVKQYTNLRERSTKELQEKFWTESMKKHGFVSDAVISADQQIKKLKKQRDDIEPEYSWLNQL